MEHQTPKRLFRATPVTKTPDDRHPLCYESWEMHQSRRRDERQRKITIFLSVVLAIMIAIALALFIWIMINIPL